MHALAWFNSNLWLNTGERLDLLRENTGCIDNMAGTYSHLLITKCVVNMHTRYFTLLGNKGSHFRIVGDRGSILRSSTDESHGQTGIIGLRIVVHVAFFQALSNKGWRQLQYLLTAQMAMPANVAAARQQIIQQEASVDK